MIGRERPRFRVRLGHLAPLPARARPDKRVTLPSTAQLVSDRSTSSDRSRVSRAADGIAADTSAVPCVGSNVHSLYGHVATELPTRAPTAFTRVGFTSIATVLCVRLPSFTRGEEEEHDAYPRAPVVICTWYVRTCIRLQTMACARASVCSLQWTHGRRVVLTGSRLRQCYGRARHWRSAATETQAAVSVTRHIYSVVLH